MYTTRYVAGAALLAFGCGIAQAQCSIGDDSQEWFYYACQDITWNLIANVNGYDYTEGQESANSWCSYAYTDCNGQNHGPQEFKGTESLESEYDGNDDSEFWWDLGNQSGEYVDCGPGEDNMVEWTTTFQVGYEEVWCN